MFPASTAQMKSLVKIEAALKKGKHLRSHKASYFSDAPSQYKVEDDHVPFMKRDVPILHLITLPFPPVWHKVEDDATHLDRKSIHNLLLIFKIFVLEYLKWFIRIQCEEKIMKN